MLAVYDWIRYWRPYVWGTSFKVHTDHSPLRSIKTKKDVTRRLTRMILNLQEYDFVLYYTPGKKNVVADALSRAPFAEERCYNMEDKIKEEAITPQELLFKEIKKEPISKRERRKHITKILSSKEKKRAKRWFDLLDKMEDPIKTPFIELAEMQAKDDTIKWCIRNAIENNVKGLWVIKDECLFRIGEKRRRRGKNLQLVVPIQLREEIMKTHHDDLLGGHCGFLKTLNKILQWYWWPKMRGDIKDWVQTCNICQTHSRNYGPKIGKLAPVMAEYPFQMVGMDIVTSFPVTERGNRSIIVFTDYYTKWVEAFAIPNEETVTIAYAFIKGIICRHGAPTYTISDRGVQFTSDIMREVTEMLGVKQKMTATYNPMADGQAEKAIGTLTNTLSKLVDSNPNDWDLILPYALWAYRTAVHATTKETPYFLVYGREPVDPTDVRVKHWLQKATKIETYTKEIGERLLEAKERVNKEVKRMKKASKERYDKDRINSPYQLNDIVWWKANAKTKEENRKLMAKYRGPYKITEVIKPEGHGLNVEITHIILRINILSQ